MCFDGVRFFSLLLFLVSLVSVFGLMCDFVRFFSSSRPFPPVPPSVKAVNHVVGAPVESHVLLECTVEVFPKPLNGWYRNDGKKIQDITPTNFSLILCLSIAKFVLPFLFCAMFFLFLVSLAWAMLYLTPCIMSACRRHFVSLYSSLLCMCRLLFERQTFSFHSNNLVGFLKC